jgi:hypothetical protein
MSKWWGGYLDCCLQQQKNSKSTRGDKREMIMVFWWKIESWFGRGFCGS